MKNSSKFLLVASIILFISLNSQAAPFHTDSTVKVTNVQDKVFKVTFTARESKTIYLRVVNERGDVLNRDYIRNENGFVKAYDFQKLKAGIYTIEVYERGHLLTAEEVIVPIVK
jgi:uncharacterized protein (DUF2141 family)